MDNETRGCWARTTGTNSPWQSQRRASRYCPASAAATERAPPLKLATAAMANDRRGAVKLNPAPRQPRAPLSPGLPPVEYSMDNETRGCWARTTGTNTTLTIRSARRLMLSTGPGDHRASPTRSSCPRNGHQRNLDGRGVAAAREGEPRRVCELRCSCGGCVAGLRVPCLPCFRQTGNFSCSWRAIGAHRWHACCRALR